MNAFLKVVKIGIVLIIGWVLLLAAIGKLLDNRLQCGFGRSLAF